MEMKQYLNPARNKDESFADYKIRRCSSNYFIEDKLSGTLVWNSIKCSIKEGEVICIGNTYKR